MNKIISIIVLLILSGSISGQQPVLDNNSASSQKKKQRSFAIFPQIGYGDDTGVVLGLVSYFRRANKTNKELFDQADVMLTGTEKSQFQVQVKPKIYFDSGNSNLDLKFKYRKWPTTFYGVENLDPKMDGMEFTPEKFSFTAKYERKIKSNYSYTLISNQMHSVILENEDAEYMKQYPGSERYFLSGVGLGLAWDSRDSKNFGTKGVLASVQMMTYRNWLGSEYDYEQIKLDLREFISLKENHILAFQQLAVFSSNVLPFEKMFKTGDYARAYPSNIFLNRQGFAFRTEYRVFPFKGKIWERIGFVAFYDNAVAARDMRHFSIDNFHYSVGLGLRISLFVKDRFNLRIDYGKSETGTGMDISGGDTF